MTNLRWLLAIPVMLAATLVAAPAAGAAETIRDRGGMFSKEAVKKADALLEKVQQASGVPILIETIDAIPDLERNAPRKERRHAIDALAVERDRRIHDEGIYLLISKRDHVISHVMIRERLADMIPIGKRDAIRDAFVEEFEKEGGFDAGLLSGAKAIEKALEGVSVHGAGVAAHRPWICACSAPGGRRRTGGGGAVDSRHVPHDHSGHFRRLACAQIARRAIQPVTWPGLPRSGGHGNAGAGDGWWPWVLRRPGLWRARRRVLLGDAGRARRSIGRELAV